MNNKNTPGNQPPQDTKTARNETNGDFNAKQPKAEDPKNKEQITEDTPEDQDVSLPSYPLEETDKDPRFPLNTPRDPELDIPSAEENGDTKKRDTPDPIIGNINSEDTTGSDVTGNNQLPK